MRDANYANMRLRPVPSRNIFRPLALAGVLAAPGWAGEAAEIPGHFLQQELVAELNGLVDKYRKLVTTSLSQNYKELKVRKVSLTSVDEQFLYAKFDVRVREINGLTSVVLYTLDGTAKGKFAWGPHAGERGCVAAAFNQWNPLTVTETKDIPRIGTPEEADAAKRAIQANFPKEVCVSLWPSLSVKGTIATEKTKGTRKHPPRTNSLRFQVSLSNHSARNVRVKYGTADGSAKAGVDYHAATGELFFEKGTKSRTIEIRIIPRDGNQGSRQMVLNLWSPVNAKIAVGRANGVILDTGQSIPSGAVPPP